MTKKLRSRKYKCSGSYFRINHARFRWTAPKSNALLETFGTLLKSCNTEREHNEINKDANYKIHPQTSNLTISSSSSQKCEKTLAVENKMIQMKTHNNFSLVYECGECDMRFNGDEKLKCHIETIHDQNSDEIFECNICDAEFLGKEVLKIHNEAYHSSNKSYQCQQCDICEQRQVACSN